MSTFTGWNGPQGSNIRANDLTNFANAYSELVTKLNAHLSERTSSDNVHNSKDYVDMQIAEVKALIPDISNLLTQLDAENTYAKKEQIPDVSSFVKSESLEDYATKVEIADYLKKNDLSTLDVIVAINDAINELEIAINKTSIKKAEVAADIIEGLVKATEQIQFTDKEFSASIGGSDDVGVYYILGMIKGKGTAYINMENTKPFNAVIDFVVTPEWKGALTVITDCELEGLKFKVVSGTSSSGDACAYLAIQSTEWIANFESSDGVGKFNSIDFKGSGINFIPVGSEGYIIPNSSCHDVCDCLSGFGFSFSKLATTILNERIYKEEDNPYLTKEDINVLDTIGTIYFWPKYDDDGIAVDFPDWALACDGADIPPEYTELIELIGDTLPLQDYCIIKAKNIAEIA